MLQLKHSLVSKFVVWGYFKVKWDAFTMLNETYISIFLTIFCLNLNYDSFYVKRSYCISVNIMSYQPLLLYFTEY